MRSAMCAFAGTTGRIQISKICALPRDVRVGEELEHPARERLDVGVVAVVDAADLADALVQAARSTMRCSPSQARATDSAAKSGCARVTSIGNPNEIAVARVSFSRISTSIPDGRVPRRPTRAAARARRAASRSAGLQRARPSRRARRR